MGATKSALSEPGRVLGSILRPSALLPFVSLGKGAADCAAQKSMGMRHGQ
jgi:hypothetical protein